MNKVLIYRNELLPPSETFIISQAKALRRFTPLFGGLRRLSDGLDLEPYRILTMASDGLWVEKLKRRMFLRVGRSVSFLRAIAEEMPQIVHAHFAVDACAILPIVTKLRMPLVVTLHGYDVACAENVLRHWPATRAYIRRKTALLDYAASFLCVSEHVRQRALALGFPESKLWVHHTGVDLNKSAQQQWQRDENMVLFAGRLVEKKGCSYVIQAMSLVRKKIPQAKLVIAGDGPLRKTLEAEAARHCPNTVFLGFQTNESVRQWMRQARVLAAPSVRAGNGDSEGLPTVLCEAQAEELPPVAFATNGVTEAFPMEHRAALPQERDVAGLAALIVHFLKDEETWQKTSSAGRQFMESHFDLYAQTKMLEDKYEEVIARHRA